MPREHTNAAGERTNASGTLARPPARSLRHGKLLLLRHGPVGAARRTVLCACLSGRVVPSRPGLGFHGRGGWVHGLGHPPFVDSAPRLRARTRANAQAFDPQLLSVLPTPGPLTRSRAKKHGEEPASLALLSSLFCHPFGRSSVPKLAIAANTHTKHHASATLLYSFTNRILTVHSRR